METFLADETQALEATLLPATMGTVDDIAERFAGYEFDTAQDAISELATNESPASSPRYWDILFDERENEDCIAYYWRRKFGSDVYAIIWERDDGAYELAFADVKPLVDWVHRARGAQEEAQQAAEQETETDETENDLYHEHDVDKHQWDEAEEDDEPESQTSQQDSRDGRIESDIPRDSMLVLIAARLTGCLQEPDKIKNRDYYHIVEGYPELDPLLGKITSFEALEHHEDKLPYALTQEDKNRIHQMIGDLHQQKEEQENPYESREEIELEKALEF